MLKEVRLICYAKFRSYFLHTYWILEIINNADLYSIKVNDEWEHYRLLIIFVIFKDGYSSDPQRGGVHFH